MANPSTDQRRDDEPENRGNSADHPSSSDNRVDERISTTGDTALYKGSRTGARKDEQEASDNYETNVS